MVTQELGERWGISATFGAMTFDTPPPDFDSTLRVADDMMYRGKAEGGSRVVQGTWPGPAAGGHEPGLPPA